MKLTDFDKKDYASRALQENYELPFNVKSLSILDTKNMLKKVRTLAMEAKQSPNFYDTTTTPAYMKLVFMEQALVKHFNMLAARPKPRIVVENEEVEKSQAILAAQDMVDTVQKMVEQVSDMLVKELPALTQSIESEIGVNESQTFSTQVTEALTALNTTLTESRTTLQNALNGITGQGGGPEAFAPDAGGADMAAPEGDMAAPEGDMAAGGADMAAPELPAEPEAPEVAPTGGAGREKR